MRAASEAATFVGPVASTQGTCAQISRTAFWSEFPSFQPDPKLKGLVTGPLAQAKTQKTMKRTASSSLHASHAYQSTAGKKRKRISERQRKKKYKRSNGRLSLLQTILRWSGTTLHVVILDIITAPTAERILSLVPSRITRSEAAVDTGIRNFSR